MTFTLQVKQEALDEVRDAYFYYENKQIGLGERFLDSLQYRLKQLTQTPQHYSFVSADKEKTMRDIKLQGFPYVVIYDIEGIAVIVYSIHSTHKRPK